MPRNLTSGRSALQRRLLGLLTLGFTGTGAELLLLDHTEGFWQKVPVVVIALGLLALAAHAFSKRAACLRLFQSVMLLMMASGVAGLILHFRGTWNSNLKCSPTTVAGCSSGRRSRAPRPRSLPG